jgi:hypothetical protein
MTREEEIHKAAEEFAFSHKTETPNLYDVINDFYYGAKWADKNPNNKCLEYQKQKFIEKAKEWLERTLYIHTEIEEDKHWCETNHIDWVTSDYDSVEDFINGFCEIMEG